MASNYDGNFNYARYELDIHPCSMHFEVVLAAMEKYQDNHWWHDLKGNPQAQAAMQVHESVLLIPRNTLKKGIEKVIGRKISEQEVFPLTKAMKEEFENKYIPKDIMA